MSGYVVPGGSTVQPALVAYRPVSLTANTTLVWPAQSQSPTDFAARVMNVTAGAGPFNLTLPPATQVSTGFDLIIVNVGSNNFNVNSNVGVTLATITPGQVYYFNLTDNTTQGGTWYSFLFGAGSSSLSAAAIAGFGLIATGATLSQNRVVNTTSASPINIAATDRASVYVWQGGGGTVNLPAVSTLTNGFFFSLTNEGTGTLTITPNGADTIDANSSLTLQPNLSVTIFSNQTSAWFTVGRVPSQQFNFTELVQTVTGGTFTETLTQAQNVVQRFIGTLTSGQTVVFPNIVQIYYVQNATAGAFNLQFSAAGGGSSVIVPQGTNAILFSDGSNVINASNAQLTATTSISIASGSVSAPSLNFGAATTPDPTTGLYQTAQGRVDVTCLGVQQAEFSSTGLALNNNATAKAFIPTGSTVPTNGMYLPATNTVGFAANSIEVLSISTVGATISGTSGVPLSLNAPAATVALQINSAASSYSGIGLTENGVPKWGIFEGNVATGTLSFFCNTTGASQFYINSNGNATFAAPSAGVAVTIVPVSGGDALDINASFNANNQVTIQNTNAGTSASSQLSIAGINGASNGSILAGNGTWQIGTYTNTPVVFQMNSAERMRLSVTNGNLLVGGTTDLGAGYAIQAKTATANSALWIDAHNTGATGTSQTVGLNLTSITAGSTASLFLADNNGSPYVQFSVGTAISAVHSYAPQFAWHNQAGSVTFATLQASGLAITGTSGGNQLTVGTPAHGGVLAFNTTDGGAATLYWADASTTSAVFGPSINIPLGFQTNNTSRGSIAAAGNWTINAPTSGTALHVGAASGAIALDVNADGGGTYYEVGFRDTPPNAQSGNYTFALKDRALSTDSTNAGAQTFTIPANGTTAFPIGTVLHGANIGTTALSIAITTDTMTLAGTATTGTRTVAVNGVYTIKKTATTKWIITGPGVS